MTQKIAIIGAGPVGIEAAVRASLAGFEVDVYERGRPGENVLSWGHVRLFSPWELNRSAWSTALLRDAGVELAPKAAFPTGREYVETYLRPLAERVLEGRIHRADVRGVGRPSILKGEEIGGGRRVDAPFYLHVESDGSERHASADVVIDASGVYKTPNAMGPGGLPALGEAKLDDRIERGIPDVLGAERAHYAGRHVLLVGGGHSAVTTLRLLCTLREEAPATRVTWVLRDAQAPYAIIADDPLPERRALSRFGNEAASGKVEGVATVHGFVTRLHPRGEVVEVTVAGAHEEHTIAVERIVSNVGYRPDIELSRELQIHHCYASEGPMKLAASLLAQSGNADCLAQTSAGIDVLRSPEPDYWVLGSKSYGRNPNFLLRIGFEQIAQVFDELERSAAA